MMTSLCNHTAVYTCPDVSGCNENGEPAEHLPAPESCDAARSSEAFWEGSVCLSGAQGNYDSPVSDITGGRAVFEASDWLCSPVSGLDVSLGLRLGGGGVSSPWGKCWRLGTGCQGNRQ